MSKLFIIKDQYHSTRSLFDFNFCDDKKKKISKIKEIHERDKIPIIVGGTHYYIQSLLWKNTLIGDGSISGESDSDEESEFREILDAETEVLYERLQEVDPVMANRWHWNDRRKIRRSLQIYLQTGKPHSEWIKEQHQHRSVPHYRFPRTCIFWLYADLEVLDQRLDARVDKMIERGLFNEIEYLRNEVKDGKMHVPPDQNAEYTRGIWQAIGYKEFDPYLKALEDAQKSGLDDPDALETWNRDVRDKAISIAEEYIRTGNGPDPSSINPELAELLKPAKDTEY
ncbi:13202_t:CDS:2 [Acaulospora colombiana]|uniref:13202_t:CDS:1 n=1 Tax=Acaulospora colombiana TaxID=27376 RepID=A0ACA9L0P4_9GLOM|nr:13202_t:CDS:2 [Acaulospora colombiana]